MHIAGLTLQLQVIVWRAAVTDGGRGEAAVCRKVVVVTELCSELSLHVGGRGVDGGHLLELREVPRPVVVGVALGWVGEGHCIGRRREHAGHGSSEPSGHGEPQLVHPLLFTSLVLEPDLDHSHGQPSVFSKLLPHSSGRFGVLIEDVPQHLQLLGLDSSPRASPLPVLTLLLVVLLLLLFVFLVRLLWRLGEVCLGLLVL